MSRLLKRCAFCQRPIYNDTEYCDATCAESARKREEEFERVGAWEAAQGPEYWEARARSLDASTPKSPEHARRKQADRRARQLRPQVYDRDGHRCQLCGATDDLCIDHVVPVAMGGGDALSNLQVLCRTCNSRKGAR
jgi:5-methylcytosine-specific restriction endonuclease McrA